MATYFISDLHLSATKPHLSALFLKFLSGDAKKADALYILGDLFEAWLGDDNPDPHNMGIINALYHKSFNNTMKNSVVIKARVDIIQEVLRSLGSRFII